MALVSAASTIPSAYFTPTIVVPVFLNDTDFIAFLSKSKLFLDGVWGTSGRV